MKTFKGKAIYNPSGKAGEYSYWACNFYIGCSNGCSYCYLKRGRGAKILGGDKLMLKKCFKNEAHALDVFEREMLQNRKELQEHGLFFSFTTDPMLPETEYLTITAITLCIAADIPVKILTKRADWYPELIRHLNSEFSWKSDYKNYIAFGFTLTGHDELESGASANAERIEAMRKLHEAGFKTFASIEPVIDTESSLDMIEKSAEFCNLFKVGLESGRKYKDYNLEWFMDWAVSFCNKSGAKIYFKDDLLKAAGISRSELPDNCVTRDYNIFNL
jgi:DNA repair photolyase